MDKQREKDRKKYLKKIEKEEKKKGKAKKEKMEELEREVLPPADLKGARKEHSEKAYAIYLISRIVEICNKAISGKKDIPQDERINARLEDLYHMASSDSWYYHEKVNELTFNEEEKKHNHILKTVDKIHVKNWNNYMLNIVERSLIYLHVHTFFLRSKSAQVWDEKQWKYSRSSAESLLFMIRSGVEEKQILDIEISINEDERITQTIIEYGHQDYHIDSMDIEEITHRLFANKSWLWKKHHAKKDGV